MLRKFLGLFGANGASAPAGPAATTEYNGYRIEATPYSEGGQYQLSGVITREIDGELKEHRFVRADRFAAHEDAVTFTFVKARQIIDEAERLGGKNGLFGR